MKMKIKNNSYVGFEVISEEKNKVVFRKTISPNLSSKKRERREHDLPIVVMHTFDDEDIEHLHEIQSRMVSQGSLHKKTNVFERVKTVTDFIFR